MQVIMFTITTLTTYPRHSINVRRDLPQTAPISEIIKIGETLTILVYIKDNEKLYDIRVRDCWAYDGEDYESRDTHKLQLTDTEGCPK
jgi:hypothetical protein